MTQPSFYKSPEWIALRAACLKRDGHRCTVKGCTSKYRLTADHINTRPRYHGLTPADVLSNLRTLCGYHDAQVKEVRNGKRRNGGVFTVRGMDASGQPVDPLHAWNQPQVSTSRSPAPLVNGRVVTRPWM